MIDFADFLNINSDLYWSIIFPFIIALSRIADVVLGTFRIILVIQGKKILATIFGFFEVLIWIMVAGQVMSQLDHFSYYLAWATGFASGTYIGMTVEERISLGTCILRIIVKGNAEDLLSMLSENDVYNTVVDARSRDDKETTIVFSIIPRKKLREVEGLIERIFPDAIYTVENVRSVHQGVMPAQDSRPINFFRRVFPRGKSK